MVCIGSHRFVQHPGLQLKNDLLHFMDLKPSFLPVIFAVEVNAFSPSRLTSAFITAKS